ncbi:hypothetical protein BpHYR1_023507 [Brachionus plicatilis]|uniref:Uncharacterized protein n=1 Tax=Brachionus plicatilis TaxID=10195 RepID=A0A3M7P5P0_BRAPC|nr:hypothetical protein BpHYR1_023507 [Brachionus plicatilis]
MQSIGTDFSDFHKNQLKELKLLHIFSSAEQVFDHSNKKHKYSTINNYCQTIGLSLFEALTVSLAVCLELTNERYYKRGLENNYLS